MTGMWNSLPASLVPPSFIPRVKKHDGFSVKQENYIRSHVREMSQARIMDRNAGRRMKYKIYFFRVTDFVGESGYPATGGSVREYKAMLQKNDAAPNQPPIFNDDKLSERIFDFWNVIDKRSREKIYQCFWFSEANCWLPLPTCEGEETSSSCDLATCSSFWGVSAGDGVYNVYDHSGGYVNSITDPLSWTECGIEEGDIVGIDTDENCIPKITPDPCTVIKRLCGSSSSSSPSSSSPYGDEIPCECLPAISMDWNRYFGVTNTKGTFFQLGTGPTLTRPAQINPFGNGVYYHDPDPNYPTLPQNPPSLSPQLFNNGVALGPEYVACLGVDECTCWSFIEATCQTSNAPYGSFIAYYLGNKIGTKYTGTLVPNANNSPIARQAFPMYKFDEGSCTRSPSLPLDYAGIVDGPNQCGGNDYHELCNTQKRRATATLEIGGYPAMTTIATANGFAFELGCEAPRVATNPSGICGSWLAGGLNQGESLFTGLPAALPDYNFNADQPRMSASFTFQFFCNGTTNWTCSGRQLTTGGPSNAPSAYEYGKNFGQYSGQPFSNNPTWNPDTGTASGTIVIGISTTIGSGTPTYSHKDVPYTLTVN